MQVSKCWEIVEFPKISIKMKNCKTSYKVHTGSLLRKLFSLLPTHPPSDIILLRLWNKNFLTEIYRNMQTFAFKVLQECTSWASRNGAVQILHHKNMFAGTFVKSEESFLTLLRQHIIFNAKRVVVRKICEVFRAKLVFFAGFYWLWDFLLENLKSKKNLKKKTLTMSTGMSGRILKKMYAQSNILIRRIPNVRFWIIYIFDPNLFFWELL